MQLPSQNFKDRYDQANEYGNAQVSYGTRSEYRHVYMHDSNGRVVCYAMRVPSWRDYYRASSGIVQPNTGYAYVLRKPRNVRTVPHKPTSSIVHYNRAIPNYGPSPAMVRSLPNQLPYQEEEHIYARNLSNAYRRACYVRRQSTNPLYAAYKTPAENSYVYSAYCLNPKMVNVNEPQNTESSDPETRSIACGSSQVLIVADIGKKATPKKAKNSKRSRLLSDKAKLKSAPVASSFDEAVVIEEIQYVDDEAGWNDTVRDVKSYATKEVMTETIECACGDRVTEKSVTDKCEDQADKEQGEAAIEKSDAIVILPINLQVFFCKCVVCIRKFIDMLSQYLIITRLFSVP